MNAPMIAIEPVADTSTGKGRISSLDVMRGFLLVVLELTVTRFSWTFNFDYARFVLAGVIWMQLLNLY